LIAIGEKPELLDWWPKKNLRFEREANCHHRGQGEHTEAVGCPARDSRTKIDLLRENVICPS